MNILLQTLLLVGGINLIAARYVPLMPLEDDVYRPLIWRYNHGLIDNRVLHELFADYTEEDLSKEPMISQTNDELEVKQLKELESFMSTLLSANDDDDNVDETKEIADVSKKITNEKDADNKSDNNNNDNDDKNEKDDDDISDNNNNDNDDKNEKDDDDKSEKNDDDKSDNNDDKTDNDADDNKDDNNTKEDKEEEAEIIDNSNEEIPIEPRVVICVGEDDDDDYEDDDEDDDDDDDTEHVETISVANVPLEKHELSEKEIRELTSFLVTLSTMEDLLKVVEQDEDNSKDAEELFEQKLKEVDNFMGLFVNTLDVILDETSEVGKDKEKSENDDDKNDKDDKDDSKDDNDNDDNDNDDNDDNDDDKKEKPAPAEDNNNDGASVSMEFHSVDTQTNTKNMDTHKYNIINERSITTVHDFKPTSSPYTPETYSSSSNPNAAIIHEYVEEREQLDELQENLLVNKLNMDKDFYHIIANEGDDKELEKFGNDIAAVRENIFKMKQSIEAIQDIKSKLYFHQLIKSALKGAQII